MGLMLRGGIYSFEVLIRLGFVRMGVGSGVLTANVLSRLLIPA